VALFVGSDVRWKPAMEQEFKMSNLSPIEDLNFNDSEDHLMCKLRYIRSIEKYADLIINTEDAAQLQLRPYLRNSRFIDLRNIRPNIKQRKVPNIIHSPSKRDGKGTKHVLKSIQNLSSQNLNFTFNLIENLSNTKALKKYALSDILIGQLFAPSGGKQDMEALASGTVVLSNNDPHYMKDSPLQYPIVHTDPNNIDQVLRETILSHEKRQKIAETGVMFAKKHLNVVDFCKNILNLLETKKESKYFIRPTFITDHYIPRNTWETDTINKSNMIVNSEFWYRKYIKSSHRCGLIF
jgi:hypothetical protein